MTVKHEQRRASVGWLVTGTVVLCAGIVLSVVSGAAVVDRLWFVDDAVALKAPGRYRVTAARASTWTLLQELTPAGALSPVVARVRALDKDRVVRVEPSAAAYRYSRAGVDGFSAYDLRLPSAGDYEVELTANAAVTMRLIDDVQGRLSSARRGLVRTAALAAGALALALACCALAWLVPARRPRARVMAPSVRVSPAQKRAAAAPSRSLQVLPALPTSIALQRYNLPPPKKPSPPRARADTRRVPSVA